MSSRYLGYTENGTQYSPDCAFEPDAVEVRCVECQKTTGLSGTCNDIDFCASCKEDYILSSEAHGSNRTQAEAEFSALLITLIEGAPYKAKYAHRRVLHIESSGNPLCGARGGPHPLTINAAESNCKRCLAKARTK
jgi:hypothetical protein